MHTGLCPIHCPQVYFRSDKAGMRPEELQARQRQAQEMQAALQQQIEEKKRIKVGPDRGSQGGVSPYTLRAGKVCRECCVALNLWSNARTQVCKIEPGAMLSFSLCRLAQAQAGTQHCRERAPYSPQIGRLCNTEAFSCSGGGAAQGQGGGCTRSGTPQS